MTELERLVAAIYGTLFIAIFILAISMLGGAEVERVQGSRQDNVFAKEVFPHVRGR